MECWGGWREEDIQMISSAACIFMSLTTPIMFIIRNKALHKAVPKRKSASPMSWRSPPPILCSIFQYNHSILRTQLELFFFYNNLRKVHHSTIYCAILGKHFARHARRSPFWQFRLQNRRDSNKNNGHNAAKSLSCCLFCPCFYILFCRP